MGNETNGRDRVQPRRPLNTVSQDVQEMIRAHEAQIQKLKQDLERQQTGRGFRSTGQFKGVPSIIDLEEAPRRRREDTPKNDPYELLP